MEVEIASRIYFIRGSYVMLDYDLASMYSVDTRVLKQAVRRNIERFPEDFLFELTPVELQNLRSQIVTSSWGGTRYPPFAFTEQGVAMLSSVIRSERAVQVNIAVMRTFVQMRKLVSSNKEMARQIELLEGRITKKLEEHDNSIWQILETLKSLIAPESKPRKAVGFKRNNEL